VSRYHTVGGLALYLNVFIRVVQALQKLLVLSRVGSRTLGSSWPHS